jgi:ParB-like chromosome segregation protein Spo0J
MKIEMISTADLIPYVNNARVHSDEQVTQIASSIKEFGFTVPVLIDKDKGIIAGHGRIAAAKKLNIDEVPCIRIEHLTETQKKAYILADNRIALNSTWDYELLGLELNSLKEADFDITEFGFDESEFRNSVLDYSILDEEDVSDEIDSMSAGVKKAIQIEFDPEHYEEAQEVIKWWRQKGANVGYMVLRYLQAEKAKA